MARFLAFALAGVAFFILAALVNAAPEQDVLDSPAASVNRQFIAWRAVLFFAEPEAEQTLMTLKGKEQVDKLRELCKGTLNHLIGRTLVLQEFWSKGYRMPETAIDGKVNEVIQNEFDGDRQRFLQTLKDQGFSLESFRNSERDHSDFHRNAHEGLKGTHDERERNEKQEEWLRSLRAKAVIKRF